MGSSPEEFDRLGGERGDQAGARGWLEVREGVRKDGNSVDRSSPE